MLFPAIVDILNDSTTAHAGTLSGPQLTQEHSLLFHSN